MVDSSRKLLGAALLLALVGVALLQSWRNAETDAARSLPRETGDVPLPQHELRLASQRDPENAAMLGALTVLENARAAEHADPLNPDRPARVGELLAGVRAFPEARAAFDRALALAPARVELVAAKIATLQAEGDLTAADALLSQLPPPRPGAPKLVDVRHRQLLYQRRYADAVALLDDVFGQAARAKTATGWVRLNFHIEVGRLRALMGHTTASSEFQLALHLDGELRAAGADPRQLASVLGLVHAGLGNKTQAISAAEAWLAATADDQPAGQGARLQLAEIHARFGDAREALALLRKSLAAPYGITSAALRLDPAWASLRGNPAFDVLSTPAD